MGCAALRVVRARFVEAQLAVDGQAHIGGVSVFLAVVLPPAQPGKASLLPELPGSCIRSKGSESGLQQSP